jgi:methyltransferase
VTFFIIIYVGVILQRLLELRVAKRNERVLKAKGAVEYGGEHYKWIVLLHSSFLVSLGLEVAVKRPTLAFWECAPLIIFILCQVFRIWVLTSLGPFWNTKILVLPGAEVVVKGPYRYIKHPNYLVVALEILVLPLIFQAFLTAFIFTLLNAGLLLGVRIPAEERALKEYTNYRDSLVGQAFKKE